MTIPTLSELKNSIIADLENELTITIPIFEKVFLNALASVQAVKLKMIYLAIAKVQKNIFVDTADPENTGGTLERFGRVKLNRNPFPAVAGHYDVEVTGDIGAVIPASTTFKSNDDSLNPSKLFQLDVEYTLIAATDTINVRALESGLDSKLLVNDVLTVTSPIANVDDEAVVTLETVQPFEEESTESYREASIKAYQLEPQGGAATDYRLWSLDAQGVNNTYPYAKSGDSNVIDLFVEANVSDSIDGKGTPSGLILDDVEEVIEFDPDNSQPLEERGRRPLGVFEVNVLAITPLDVDINIDGLVGTTPEIESEITLALTSEIDKIRPFIAASDILSDKNDILDINKIIGVILETRPGSIFGTVTLDVDGNNVNTFTFLNGDIPFVNSVTFS